MQSSNRKNLAEFLERFLESFGSYKKDENDVMWFYPYYEELADEHTLNDLEELIQELKNNKE